MSLVEGALTLTLSLAARQLRQFVVLEVEVFQERQLADLLRQA